MADPSRREWMIGAGGLAGAAGMSRAAIPPNLIADAADDMARYIGFGDKASGGPGDEAAGAWMEGLLKQAGFATDRLPFTAPFFKVSRAELSIGGTVAAVNPQAIVVPTSANGITGPLHRVVPGIAPTASIDGAIALVDLPYNRWSSALAKPIRDTVDRCLAAGAVAVVLLTNGPTGQAIALNADGRKPMFAKPVAILAPDRAMPFLIAAERGERATLTVTGQGGRRPAYNVLGRLDRKRPHWVVVSTPRSGWFTCAGERGGGIAAWCALARWAPVALPGVNLLFLGNSGHEYEYLGAEQALGGALAAPSRTMMWLHLGANVAARDWQELTGTLLPLPSADPQRYLVTSPALVEPARRLLAGQPGLEVPYPTDRFAAGELASVIAAGYPTIAGIFGAHRFHHVATDDARCVMPDATAAVIAAMKTLLTQVVAAA